MQLYKKTKSKYFIIALFAHYHLQLKLLRIKYRQRHNVIQLILAYKSSPEDLSQTILNHQIRVIILMEIDGIEWNDLQ